jgi:hypothetical protein
MYFILLYLTIIILNSTLKYVYSHTTTTQYWSDATEQTLSDEFAGEKETIAMFANIPAGDINAVRTPFLVLADDRTFNVRYCDKIENQIEIKVFNDSFR